MPNDANEAGVRDWVRGGAQAAGEGQRQGLTGEKRLPLRLWVFLFVLLKCYIDNAAFNYPGGAVRP